MHSTVRQSPQSRRAGALPPRQLKRVLEFIEANIHRPLRTCELAAVVNLSAKYFAPRFRRVTAESPLGYLHRRRIERAKKMMLAGDESLAEIALACGLADQPHLTRLFRRLTGSTPAAWRRGQRAAAIEANYGPARGEQEMTTRVCRKIA